MLDGRGASQRVTMDSVQPLALPSIAPMMVCVCYCAHQGGFHLIGSGRDKIEGPDKLAAAVKTCTDLNVRSKQAACLQARVC